MSWRRKLLGSLLAAALVAHVFMLAGHHHGGTGHASTTAVVTHLVTGTSTVAGSSTTQPTGARSGAAALGAACLAILATALFGCRRSGGSGADDRSLVRRHGSPRTTALARRARPLRPPRTLIAERVVLLT
jgi:hypothetical protein